jgi:protoporphyrinogen oxidase
MKKIVIIGAGPAGLTAAYKLLKENNKYDITIIEKSNIVGGISTSITFDGYTIDTGIHRFFTKNDEVNQIWNDLLPIQGKLSYDDKILDRNIELSLDGPDPEKEDNVMLIKNRLTRIYYDNKFFNYPVSLNADTLKKLGFINVIKIGCSYLKSCIFKRKEESLEDLYINKFGESLYQMFFESYTEKVWGRHPSQISADWVNQRVKGISIKEVIKDFFRKKFNINNKNNTQTSLIESFYYPKKGSKQIWDLMLDYIINQGGKIIYSSEVVNINFLKDKVRSVDYKNNGKIYNLKCDYLISSMPIKNLFEAFNGPVIPKRIYDSAINLPYREFMSVGLLVNKLNLNNDTNVKTINGIIPDNWIYVQDKRVMMGRLQVFNNWSPYLFKNKKDINDKVLLTLEYFCSKDDEYWNMSDEDFINFAIKDAEKINLFSKDDVISSTRIKIDKAYPGYFDSYSNIDKIINYLNKFDNLYCIGRNGQHRYNNMDHSMLTGIMTAKHIINPKSFKKSDIWNVNTEQEYHEVRNDKND